ncbi:hypothetical protein AMST5_03385 [freshwater sediment metagenome]|uniref:Uncharacterized protein n=1 Tax=freshwater sediment metagenome TaxID=556182 RepID=A0AA48M5E7_9ZZZZ
MNKKPQSAKSMRSELLLPFQQKLRPLHPSKRALEGAQRAFERLQRDYSSLLAKSGKREDLSKAQSDLDHPAYRQILDIAHTYWFEHRVYDRKPREDFITELAKIRKATAELSVALANAPPAVLGLLRPALKRQFSGNPVWSGLSEKSSNLSEEKKVALVLEALAAACEESPLPKDQRGAREKKHITKATVALVSFWRNCGGVFAKSLQTARGRDRSREFVSEGPQFVWHILSAIDPELAISEVRTALQKVG